MMNKGKVYWNTLGKLKKWNTGQLSVYQLGLISNMVSSGCINLSILHPKDRKQIGRRLEEIAKVLSIELDDFIQTE